MLHEAISHQEQGRFAEAKLLYERILAVDARNAKCLHSLGLLARQNGDLEGAIRLIEQALSIEPGNVSFHLSLGATLQVQRRFDEALEEFERALDLESNRAETHYAIAAILQLKGKLGDAKSHYERAVTLQPTYAAAFCNLGVVLQNLGDLDGSVACQVRAIELRPDLAEAHNNLGLLLKQLGKPEEARAHYERAIILKPNYVEALCNLGVLLQHQDRPQESLDSFLKALSLRPDFAPAFDNLGNTLRQMGRLEESAACHKRAIEIAPRFAVAHNNLGVTLRKQGLLSAARESHDRALALQPSVPDFRWNLALIDLLEGKFEAGWLGYESRHERTENRPRSFSQPLWRGESLDGKAVLLHSEQGLGDSIQFLRYVPMVSAAGGKVILNVPASLRRLAEMLPGVQHITVDSDPLPSFDFHAPLMSLPLAFKTRLESIPGEVPYLQVPEDALQTAQAIPWDAKKVRVGLVWSGNPKCTEDQNRSLKLEHFQSLFGLESCAFYSLQIGGAADQIAAFEGGIFDLRAAIHDFADTAALMTHLDLIITADTSVAHLAGALARPTWTLIPFAPDWRWLMEREDSPWYPTMRLFRQTTFGDWSLVMDRVLRELSQFSQ